MSLFSNHQTRERFDLLSSKIYKNYERANKRQGNHRDGQWSLDMPLSTSLQTDLFPSKMTVRVSTGFVDDFYNTFWSGKFGRIWVKSDINISDVNPLLVEFIFILLTSFLFHFGIHEEIQNKTPYRRRHARSHFQIKF